MALTTRPMQSNNFRLSQIAEELESLDMSLNLDEELFKIGMSNGSIYSASDSAATKSDTSSSLPDRYVDFTDKPDSLKDNNSVRDSVRDSTSSCDSDISVTKQKRKSRAGRVRVMPNCPPPPPPTLKKPTMPASPPPPPPPLAVVTAPAAIPVTPPPAVEVTLATTTATLTAPATPPRAPRIPKPQLRPKHPVKIIPIPKQKRQAPVPPSQAASPPVGSPATQELPQTPVPESPLPPPGPDLVFPPPIPLENYVNVEIPDEELPPPPPLFDLQEPVFAPPSPVTSPHIFTNQKPDFRSKLPASPLTVSFPQIITSPEPAPVIYAPTSVTSTSTTSETSSLSIVYAPTSVTSTSSGQNSEMSDETDVSVFEKVSDEDIHQVEMFYRSHKAQVYVCPGIANLYFGPARADGSGEKWELSNTGIPVLLLDTGDARRQRKIQIILAEKGSGFILWKDTIDQLSNFKSVHSNFQSMFLSNDHTKLAGLSYDDDNAASEFLSALMKFTSDPNDEALRMGKKKKKVKKPKYKAPKKTDISQPCGFVHVTKLDRTDHDQYNGSNAAPILATRNQNADLFDIRPEF